jgi:AbrB family looped-hinge helix DNA binding protein
MKELVATLTERGQVTIPTEVRDLLGLKPRDRILFAIDNGQVLLKPARFTLDSAFQSVPPFPSGVEIEDAIRSPRTNALRETFDVCRADKVP